jgi:hypothetical protein
VFSEHVHTNGCPSSIGGLVTCPETTSTDGVGIVALLSILFDS